MDADVDLRSSYYVPSNDDKTSQFFHLPSKHLHDLACKVMTEFSYDYLVEDQWTCKVFIFEIGGYLRFNYANELEVALFWDKKPDLADTVAAFLIGHGCVSREL